MAVKTGRNGTKAGLGGGSPRFRARNRAADGTFPVPPARQADTTQLDTPELQAMSTAELAEHGFRKGIAGLLWNADHANSLKAKMRARHALATLNAPYAVGRPAARHEISGPGGGALIGAITIEHVKGSE